jgi:glycyl-tRNA synthetase beta chain
VPDLLVELGCEELPAVACREATRQLEGLVRRELEAAGFPAAEVRVYVAPRRIAWIAAGLPAQRRTDEVRRRGPRADAPVAAREGFARRNSVSVDELVEEDGFLVAVEPAGTVAVEDAAPGVVRGVAEGIRFSKSMRWEGGRFSRPARWLVAKLDERVLTAAVFGLEAGGFSHGHRTAGQVEVGSAATYLEDVRSVRVMADRQERERAIRAGLDAAGEWADPLGKLAEVVDLVEWPAVLEGGFDQRFLELPERVVVTAMQSHQRYFPRTEAGRLLPRFLFVANGGQADVVIRGNQEVLVGRLADAEFAFAADLERGIEAMAGELDRVSFLEGGGSLAEKTRRVRELASEVASRVGLEPQQRAAAERAADLCKADLVSNLVGEFADLEGFAGSVYAERAGEGPAVVQAIAEHHLPYGFAGPQPATAAGAAVSVADRADTLATAFRLGLEPTGSRDPFGLRRSAAGLVAIVLERGWDVGLADLVGEDAAGFVLDRVEALLAEGGVTVEELRAARGSGLTEPVAVAGLARALHDAAGPARDALRDAYGRCRRIAGDVDPGALDPTALSEPAELRLAQVVGDTERRLAELAGDPAGMLEAAGGLVEPVTAFFDQVLVMADDPDVRATRLGLAARTAACIRRIGDLDELPG